MLVFILSPDPRGGAANMASQLRINLRVSFKILAWQLFFPQDNRGTVGAYRGKVKSFPDNDKVPRGTIHIF